MIPFVGVILAAGASPSLPGGVALGGTGSGSLTSSIAVNPSGVITTVFPSGTLAWYNPTSTTNPPGAYYYISFHLTAGSAWSAGLTDGTVYALSSARSLSWTTSTSLTSAVTASLWLDAGGTQLVGTFPISVSIN